MSRVRQVAVSMVVASAFWIAAPAQAAPVAYTMQVGGLSRNTFVLNGSRLTSFSVWLRPQTCTAGDWQNDADSAWTIALPTGQSASVAGGHFKFQGQAAPTNYPSTTGSAQFTVTGQVRSASGLGAKFRRVAHGTISFTGGSDPFVSGCSGTYKFLAVPTPTRSAAVASPNSAGFTSQFLSFDYRHGVVKHLVAQVNFECGTGPDPSVDSAPVDAEAYGFPAIHVHHGKFSLDTYVLDEYQDIVALKLSGRVHGRVASGRIKVSEPASLTGIANSACSGNYTWTASLPVPPGPAASFSWDAVRVPSGAGYRYYFYISNLTCQNGATAVNIVVKGRRTRIRCSAGQGWASHPLAPGRAYQVSAQAVKMRHGRVVAHGVRVRSTEQMPAADATWQPIPGLPGNPPS